MKSMTIDQIAEYVLIEGLGYSVENGISHESIEDGNLSGLWKQAEDILQKIQEILEPFYPNEEGVNDEGWGTEG